MDHEYHYDLETDLWISLWQTHVGTVLVAQEPEGDVFAVRTINEVMTAHDLHPENKMTAAFMRAYKEATS